MAVTTIKDEALGIVVQKVTGDLHGPDVIAAQQRLYADPDHDSSMPVLWDAREGRVSGMPANEMRQTVGDSEAFWERMRNGRTAILVGSEADFAMGRMYQQLAERMPRALQVFRNYDEALAWLRAPRD